jgi:hypothetical protein
VKCYAGWRSCRRIFANCGADDHRRLSPSVRAAPSLGATAGQDGHTCRSRAPAHLLAIALQESGCYARTQIGGGPARGFWQFEIGGGVTGVLTHPASKAHLYRVLLTLAYPPAASAVHAAIEHNDILAAVCARLLLWTDAKPLPGPTETEAGWQMYERTWRPGRPRPETWPDYYRQAWQMVTEAAQAA